MCSFLLYNNETISVLLTKDEKHENFVFLPTLQGNRTQNQKTTITYSRIKTNDYNGFKLF